MNTQLSPKNSSTSNSQRGDLTKKPTSTGFVRGNRGAATDVASKRSWALETDVEEFYANVPCTD